jgi:hypothetical protein
MMDIPDALEPNPTYENFVGKCPRCLVKNIFNRASDLETLEAIDSRVVTCQNPQCGKQFNITADVINPAHEMLVFDCYDLISQKHYMQCVLSLAQAYEVFFSLYLRVELLYKPYAADSEGDFDRLDALKKKLYQQVERYTFVPMRNLFLRQVLSSSRPRTLDGAESAIGALSYSVSEPDDSELGAVTDVQLLELLRALKASKINELRNRVVHKEAYRPTLTEVEPALEEAEKILFPLSHNLDLIDDVDYYA